MLLVWVTARRRRSRVVTLCQSEGQWQSGYGLALPTLHSSCKAKVVGAALMLYNCLFCGKCTYSTVQSWLSCLDTHQSLWCQDNPETLKQKRPLCPLHQDWNLRRLHRIVLLGTEATTKLARKTRPSHLLVPGTRRYNRSLTFVPRLWGEQILFYICGTIGSVKEWIFSNNALQGLVTYHKNGGYLPHRKREHWQ